MKAEDKYLYNLDELSDYKISSGYPDIRGWHVKDADNRVIGTVENLMVNKNTERVVYVDVEVDKTIIQANYDPYATPENDRVREFVNKDGENHVIIPIGLVDFNEDDKTVHTNEIDHRTFAETKRYKKGTHLNRDYEQAVIASYKRGFKEGAKQERDVHNKLQSSVSQTESPSTHIVSETDRERYEDSSGRTKRKYDSENDRLVDKDPEQENKNLKYDPNSDSFYEQDEFNDSDYLKRL